MNQKEIKHLANEELLRHLIGSAQMSMACTLQNLARGEKRNKLDVRRLAAELLRRLNFESYKSARALRSTLKRTKMGLWFPHCQGPA